MHRADKLRVQDMDRHLFTLSLKKWLKQSLDRKQKWVECVTIAYEAWVALKDTQTSTCQQYTLNWSRNVGNCHGMDYDQQDKFVFYKRKCNFSLALMYFKKFFYPGLEGLVTCAICALFNHFD
jgi:hypothetical protein